MLVYLAVLTGLLVSANAFTYTVTVGIDETNGQQGIGFDPSAIRPAAGDTITFNFQLPAYIKSPSSVQHSATQSTFDAPCTPVSGGFDTGIQTTGSVNTNTGLTFNLIVNDTQPLWFFSSANNDCKSGMVLAVNPPLSGDQTAAAFKQNAMSSSGPVSTSSEPTSTASNTGTSSLAAPAETAPPSSSTSGGSMVTARMELCFAGIVALIGVFVLANMY